MSHSRSSRSDDAVYIAANTPDPVFGDRGSRVTEEAGEEEAYHADGSLRWRRILRRRTTHPLPAVREQPLPRGSRLAGQGLGLVGAAVVAQVLLWVPLGAALIGDHRLGPGRGGALGYLAGSALATLIVWRLSRR